ncbi:MAG: LamG-like jellyroll fold domain-containing protein [Bacteroidota bacterium]
MKKIYPSILIFLLVILLQNIISAQDTIRVQTFDWNSETRAEVFEFPDNPDDTYRKIIMKYNMRCHDDEVGNGAVGCREWDYSCNTFITDSTRVDSTRQFHPSHTISNFSEEEFPYTTIPTNAFTQYLQYQTTLDLSNVTEAVVGYGSTTTGFEDIQTLRMQMLYRADELLQAGLVPGQIHALEMVPTDSGQMDFLRIRMKAVTESELSEEAPHLDGFTEVYFSNTTFSVAPSQRLNFYEPFDWDGSSNILIEFSFTQQSNVVSPELRSSMAGFESTLWFAGPIGSLHFDGTSNVDVPTDHFTSITDEITISMWAYGSPDILPTNSTVFEGKDDNDNRQANVHLPWGNGRVYWDCGFDGTYDRIDKLADNADFAGQWNHWAFTKNAVSGDMKIYLNGELWHEGTGKTRPINIKRFNIGSGVGGNPVYYGDVSEFRIWSKELDQATIKEWMRIKVDSQHPDYDQLVSYYPMNQTTGNTVLDTSPNEAHGTAQLANWQSVRGKDLFKNFGSPGIRLGVTLLQGDALTQNVTVPIVEESPANPHSVVYYDVESNDLVTTDTQLLYRAGYQYVFDEMGGVVDSVWVMPEDTIQIGQLTYFTRQPAKYEILSLVTPYGNGLDLGEDGKTFTFDVTDYAPILKGKKRLSIEMGGQWQEELDIEFLFIKGTPAREVLDIQNIWPFRRGWYAQIQEDRFFEPRSVSLSPAGHHYKLRSAITGHGQNGEFIPRTHYLNVNGGNQDFVYDVWKECADNPIYPQGGTWIFDRAGWCPGAATDVHEFDITSMVDPGGEVEIDYGVNGAFMDQANYLVSNQLVTYGDYQFNVDASLERIARPNNTDVEFERINPACSAPIVWVKNTGREMIKSVEITYQVEGNAMVESFVWTGDLFSNEVVHIELPVSDMGFWESPNEASVFSASITAVNGTADEYAANNATSSRFESATVFESGEDYVLSVRTNNNGSEYAYVIKNASGEIMMERDNMLSNTTYDDMLTLTPGCYTLQFFDAGHDGLQFWFFPDNGSGSLQFKRYLTPTVLFPFVHFEPDFGSGVQYDFVIEGAVSAEEDQSFQSISTFPNPVSDLVNVELNGFAGKEVAIMLTNLQGQQLLLEQQGKINSEKWASAIDLSHLPPGMYFIKIISGEKVWTNEVVKF